MYLHFKGPTGHYRQKINNIEEKIEKTAWKWEVDRKIEREELAILTL